MYVCIKYIYTVGKLFTKITKSLPKLITHIPLLLLLK